jgi:hypothetical protein
MVARGFEVNEVIASDVTSIFTHAFTLLCQKLVKPLRFVSAGVQISILKIIVVLDEQVRSA